jgi:hypothetical protein
MGIFNFWKKSSSGHEIDSTDRDNSLAVRRQNAEIKQLENRLKMEEMRLESEARKLELQARIAEAQSSLDELQGEDEEVSDTPDFNTILMTLALKFLQGKSDTSTFSAPVGFPQTSPTATASDVSPSLSDEQIDNMYKTLPDNVKKIAKTMSDEQIKNYLSKNGQNFDEETINKIIKKVKNS